MFRGRGKGWTQKMLDKLQEQKDMLDQLEEEKEKEQERQETINWTEDSNDEVGDDQKLGDDEVGDDQKPSDEEKHEMHTLAEVLNLMGSGDVKALADVLVQRFKSLELKSVGRSEAAQGVELIDPSRLGLTSRRELSAANQYRYWQAKSDKQSKGSKNS